MNLTGWVWTIVAVIVGFNLGNLMGRVSGLHDGRIEVKTEAAQYAKACRSIKEMKLGELNNALLAYRLAEENISDIRADLLPDYDCDYLDEVAAFKPHK